jgi:hypothetical protein
MWMVANALKVLFVSTFIYLNTSALFQMAYCNSPPTVAQLMFSATFDLVLFPKLAICFLVLLIIYVRPGIFYHSQLCAPAYSPNRRLTSLLDAFYTRFRRPSRRAERPLGVVESCFTRAVARSQRARLNFFPRDWNFDSPTTVHSRFISSSRRMTPHLWSQQKNKKHTQHATQVCTVIQ